MESELKIITRDEVKSHNTADNLWIIIHDKVYDLTKFQAEVCIYFLFVKLFKSHTFVILIFFSILAGKKFLQKSLVKMDQLNLMIQVIALMLSKQYICRIKFARLIYFFQSFLENKWHSLQSVFCQNPRENQNQKNKLPSEYTKHVVI